MPHGSPLGARTPGQIGARRMLSTVGGQPQVIRPVDRDQRRTDDHAQLGTLWQELAETVARAQRLMNERPLPVVKSDSHRLAKA